MAYENRSNDQDRPRGDRRDSNAGRGGQSGGRAPRSNDRDRDRNQRDNRGQRDDRRDSRSYGDRDRNQRDDRRDSRSYGDRNQRDDRRDNRSYGDRDRNQRDDRRDNRGQRDDRRDSRSYGDRDRDRNQRDNRGQRDDRRDSRGRRDDRRDDRRGTRDEQPRFAGQRSDGRSQDRRDDRFGKKKPKSHQAEYRSADPNEPVIPAGVVADEIGEEVLQALDTLAGANKEIVARHLVMAGQLIDIDADKAYEHAQAAVKRAGRVDVVREAAALTAYATGRYEEALREVRAVRRMRGDESLRAIEADSERGLGRPEKALEVIEAANTSKMPLDEQVEVILVAAGARQDLGQTELGLVLVEDALRAIPSEGVDEPRARLMSMQADLLRALGREEEALAVEEAMPVEEEVMEITDLGELLDADVDHTRTPLRGSTQALSDIYDALVLDLDGVCFEGANPIDHASEVLNQVADDGVSLSYATNNASRSADEVVQKLAGFGIPAEAQHIMTSAMDCVYLIKEQLEPGSTVLVVGSQPLEDLVKEAGFVAVRDAKGEVDAVVQGYAANVGWAELSEAAYAINNGARFYATNLDTTLPTERGMALGNGSLVAAVSRATNRRAEATGKPHPEIMIRAAATVKAENPLSVGDRLETDTAAAFAARMPSLHVLTGVSSAADVVRAKRGERPAYLALDLRGLQETHPQPKHHRDGTWTAGVSQPVSFTRWGYMVVDGIELRSDGDPVTINLDTYRAAAAAGWEATDADHKVRIPELIVVDNDDLAGMVTEPNFAEPEPEPEASGEDEALEEAITEEVSAEEALGDEAEVADEAELIADEAADDAADTLVEEAEVVDEAELIADEAADASDSDAGEGLASDDSDSDD